MKTMTKFNIPVQTVALAGTTLALVLVYVLQMLIAPNRNTIDLPTPEGEISRIEITDGAESLSIVREGEDWLVGDSQYPGDSAVIGELVDAALAIKAADVISERGGDERFGFDGDAARKLVLHGEDGPTLAFQFGAAASAGDTVYGRVQDESAVVLLPGSLDNRVQVDSTYYRDKVIARIDRETIDSVRLQAAGHPTVEMRRIAAQAGEEEAELSEPEQLERDWEVRIDGVPQAEGEEVPGHLRQNFFQELAALRAEQFPTEAPSGDAFARVTITLIDGGSEEIAIFPPDENFQYPLTTTASPYPVRVPEFRVRRLLLGRSEIIEQFQD